MAKESKTILELDKLVNASETDQIPVARPSVPNGDNKLELGDIIHYDSETNTFVIYGTYTFQPVSIDSALNTSSNNALQNKVIATAIGNLSERIDKLPTGLYYGTYAVEENLPDPAQIENAGYAYVATETQGVYNIWVINGEGGAWTNTGFKWSPTQLETDLSTESEVKAPTTKATKEGIDAINLTAANLLGTSDTDDAVKKYNASANINNRAAVLDIADTDVEITQANIGSQMVTANTTYLVNNVISLDTVGTPLNETINLDDGIVANGYIYACNDTDTLKTYPSSRSATGKTMLMTSGLCLLEYANGAYTKIDALVARTTDNPFYLAKQGVLATVNVTQQNGGSSSSGDHNLETKVTIDGNIYFASEQMSCAAGATLTTSEGYVFMLADGSALLGDSNTYTNESESAISYKVAHIVDTIEDQALVVKPYLLIPSGCTIKYNNGSFVNGYIDYNSAAIINGVVESLGYKVLKAGVSFASQVTDANMVYEIKDEFDLSGEGSITIPSNSVLKFNGGRLLGGTINMNGCRIEGNKALIKGATLSGLISNEKIQPQVFGATGDGVTDDTLAIRDALKVCNYVDIPDGEYIVTSYTITGYLQMSKVNSNAISITRDNVTLHMSSNTILRVGSINDDDRASRYNQFTSIIYVLGTAIDSNNNWTPIKNILIEGGQLIGCRGMFSAEDFSSYSRENYTGITVAYVDGITFRNIKVTDNPGNAFYDAPIWNATFDNVETARNRRAAIGIGVADGVTIKNCYFHDEKQIYTYENGNTNNALTTGAVIAVEAEPSPLVQYYYDNNIDGVKNMNISNCVLDGNGVMGIFFKGGANRLVIDNNKFLNTTVGNTVGNIELNKTGGGNASKVLKIKNVRISNNICECIAYTSGSHVKAAISIVSDGDVSIIGNKMTNMGCVIFHMPTGTMIVDGNYSDWNIFSSATTTYLSSIFKDGNRFIYRNNVAYCDEFIMADNTNYDITNCLIEIYNNTIRPNSVPRNERCVIPSFNVPYVNIHGNDIETNRFTGIGANSNLNTVYYIDNNILKFTTSRTSIFTPFGVTNGNNRIFNGSLTNNTITFPIGRRLTIPSDFSGRFICKGNFFNDNYSTELINGTSPYVVNKDNVYKAGALVKESGTSTGRPASTYIQTGYRYFDTTLGKPIFWDGITWVDSTGVVIEMGVSATDVLLAAAANSSTTVEVHSANVPTISVLNSDDTPATDWLDATLAGTTLTITAIVANESGEPKGGKIVLVEGGTTITINVVQSY